MPPSVLISFCNLGAASESGLLLCDPSRSTTRWLDLGLPTSVTGCTGIARAYELGIGTEVKLRLLRDGAPLEVVAPIEVRPESARPR